MLIVGPQNEHLRPRCRPTLWQVSYLSQLTSILAFEGLGLCQQKLKEESCVKWRIPDLFFLVDPSNAALADLLNQCCWCPNIRAKALVLLFWEPD